MTMQTQKNKLESLLSLKSETLKDFETSWQEMLRGEYYPIETLWDDIDFTMTEE